LGIHGVQLGVVYPQVAIEVLRWRFGRRLAERLLYAGRLSPGHEALREGLVDELVDLGSLPIRSRELAVEIRPEPGMYWQLKPVLQREMAVRLANIDEEGQEAWLDQWFSPHTRNKVAAARASLRERRGPRPGEALD
jgi:enoyl-CoA hydratase/carnithine racemase